MAPRRQRQRVEAWQPPHGWKCVGPGVWVPSDYAPTRWELPAPQIRNVEESKADWAKCANSLPYFAFTHAWTIDVDDPMGSRPRKIPAFPYLRQFFTEVQKPENVLTDKSRQMLLSWAWMVVFCWDVLFHKNWQALVLSKRAKDVDDGGANSTINSNLGKIRFIHSHLPEHLYVPFEYKAFQIFVPSTRSTIVGETGKGGMASRGPTWNRALMDEAAYIQNSETVFAGLRQAAKRGTALNSTPQGKGNTFARIRFSNTTTFKILTFHWSRHPRKAAGMYCPCGWKAKAGSGKPNWMQFEEHKPECPRLEEGRKPQMRSPWYDREVSDLTPDKVASELDISYEGSRAGRVYTAFDSTINVWPIIETLLGPRYIDETEEEYRLRYLHLAIDPRYQCFATIDVGVGDPASMQFGQIIDEDAPIVRFIDEFEMANQDYKTFVAMVELWQGAALNIGNPYTVRVFGGEDVKNRDSKLESWFTNFATRGIMIERSPGVGGMLEWLDFINDQYRRGHIQISDWCKHMIDAVNNYHFPVDDAGVPLPGKHLPVHDEWSHAMDAKRYLYTNRFVEKLYDRDSSGVPRVKMLRRGASQRERGAVYDKRTEGRIF